MKQRILRIVLLPILLVTALFAFGAVSAPSAHAAVAIPAGSNGQELAITTFANSVYIVGPNQGGGTARQCFQTPNVPNNPNYDWGWWWKGGVTMYSYNSTNCSWGYRGARSTYVPTSQCCTDWWYVTAV